MNREGHKIIAPIFTFGSSLILFKTGLYNVQGNDLLNISMATAVSLVSAMWADADHLATLPLPIALGTAPTMTVKKYNNKKYYYVKVSESELRRKLKSNPDLKYDKTIMGRYLVFYDKVRHPSIDMKIFMYLFRAMKLKHHRDWQSHSVIFWLLIWSVLAYVPLFVFKGSNIGAFIQVMVLGLGLGYLSHLLADKFTTAGVNQLTDGARKALCNLPIVGNTFNKILPKFKFKFKFMNAKNTNYAYVVAFIFILIFWAVLDFNSLSNVFSILLDVVVKILSEVWSLFIAILKGE